MILTDEEIKAAISPLCQDDGVTLNMLTSVSIDEYRAVEAAVLKKLSEQEPVAYQDPNDGELFYLGFLTPASEAKMTPLYTHPIPVSKYMETK